MRRRRTRRDEESSTDSGESDIGAIAFREERDSDLEQTTPHPPPSASPTKQSRVIVSDSESDVPVATRRPENSGVRGPAKRKLAAQTTPLSGSEEEAAPATRRRLNKGRRATPSLGPDDNLLAELDSDGP